MLPGSHAVRRKKRVDRRWNAAVISELNGHDCRKNSAIDGGVRRQQYCPNPLSIADFDPQYL